MASPDEFTGPTTELLQSLIRNACVNDGTPDSGEETRNSDLLLTYIEGAGLDVERFTPRIEAGPHLLEGVRRASVLERRQRLGLGSPEAHDQGEQERVDYFFRHDW